MIEGTELCKVHGEDSAAVRAVDGVSLRVEPGEFVAVVGPSGSGKTTLLSLLGLLDTPTSGTVSIAGTEVGELSEDERARLRRRQIGFVFQFFNLLPALTAEENVAVPAMLDGKRSREVARRASELLELVRLRERREHLPEQLSGGEQQRVAIARALIADPGIVLADEPTGNLDSVSGDLVLDTLVSATSAVGRCLVVVTHDDSVSGRADRVVELRDGRVMPDRRDRPLRARVRQ